MPVVADGAARRTDRRRTHRPILWPAALIVLLLPVLLGGFLTWLHFHEGVSVGKDYLCGGYEAYPPPGQRPGSGFAYGGFAVDDASGRTTYHVFGVGSGIYYLIWSRGGASQRWLPKSVMAPVLSN